MNDHWQKELNAYLMLKNLQNEENQIKFLHNLYIRGIISLDEFLEMGNNTQDHYIMRLVNTD